MTYRLRFSLVLCCTLGLPVTLIGCASQTSSSEGETAATDQAVVGGSQEAGYPSAGYLTKGALGGSPTSRLCTAVQVGPNLVLTGAHCFVDWNAAPYKFITNNQSWGFGRGEVANKEIYTADKVTIHPSYDPNGTPRYANDVALVTFSAPIPGGTWAEVAPAALGTQCGTAAASNNNTYVGYGRDTVGGRNVAGNVDGDRKSATQCVSAINNLDLRVTGVDGGLCWGDSGGPLFDTGRERVSGVLSDFDGVFDCQVGNKMIFTRLTAYKDLICNSTIYVGNGEFCGRSLAAELAAITAPG